MADDELVSGDDGLSPEARLGAKMRQAEAEAEDAMRREWDRLVAEDADRNAPEWAARWVNVAEAGMLTTEPKPAPMLLAREVQHGPNGQRLERDGSGFLPAGKVGLLAAPGGMGKSAVLIHLGLCVAANKPFMGKIGVVRPGPVLLAFGEEDAGEVHRRLKLAADALGLTDAEREAAGRRLFVLPLAGVSDRFLERDPNNLGAVSQQTEAFVAELQARTPPEGWRLIVLDPFARFGDYDAETDNAAATDTVRMAERLTMLRGEAEPDESPGATVLLAHHTRKGNADRPGVEDVRGSSALKDGARWLAVLNQVHTNEDGTAAESEDERRRAKEKVKLEGVFDLKVVKSNYTDTRKGWGKVRYQLGKGGRVEQYAEPKRAAEPESFGDV